MFNLDSFIDNDNIDVVDERGAFSVIEYKRDMSVNPYTAAMQWFCSEMDVRRRQLVCDLSDVGGITLQTGAMQWMVGDVNATTGVKGAGDFVTKAFRGAVTKESAIKPEYTGTGVLVTEPTYRYLLLVDVAEWGGGIVLDDGLFLACDSSIKQSTVMRSNVSSAVAGGEGLFNLMLSGTGIVCLEADCPKEELIEVKLRNDVLKIDGNLAVAWSPSLEFTVERAGKSLIGSAASGEGLVNVYRGTGTVWMTPVRGGGASVPMAS